MDTSKDISLSREQAERDVARAAAMSADKRLDEIRCGITGTTKECRQKLMRIYGFCRGTNVWKHGEEAYGMIHKCLSVDAHADWCWYTATMLELCDMVRSESSRLSIAISD